MKNKSIVNTYRFYASFYDSFFGAFFEKGRTFAVEKANILQNDNILEVGVGTGASLNLYPKKVSITGIDLSKEMLKVASKKNLNSKVKLLQMDAQNMDFDSETFNKVFLMHIYSVAESTNKLLAEVKRVSKPDADIYILNQFESKNKALNTIKRLATPLQNLIGFRPFFKLNTKEIESHLTIQKIYNINTFGYKLIHCKKV